MVDCVSSEMMFQFVFITESNCIIREVNIMKRNGEFYIVRFQNGKFIQLRDNRLYKLLEEQKQNFLVKRGYEKKENTINVWI